MNAFRTAVLLFLFGCQMAFADTLVLKSGQAKKGKILEETDKQFLFDSKADGMVIEVPKDTVTLIDRDVQGPAKGAVQLFSTSPRKKKNNVPEERVSSVLENKIDELAGETDAKSAAKNELFDQSQTLENFEKMISDWIQSHPEAQKVIQEWSEKFHGKSDELDKVVKASKEA